MHIVICQENELKMHETTARIQGTRQRGALRHVERARRVAATCSSSVVAAMG